MVFSCRQPSGDIGTICEAGIFRKLIINQFVDNIFNHFFNCRLSFLINYCITKMFDSLGAVIKTHLQAFCPIAFNNDVVILNRCVWVVFIDKLFQFFLQINPKELTNSSKYFEYCGIGNNSRFYSQGACSKKNKKHFGKIILVNVINHWLYSLLCCINFEKINHFREKRNKIITHIVAVWNNCFGELSEVNICIYSDSKPMKRRIIRLFKGLFYIFRILIVRITGKRYLRNRNHTFSRKPNL